MGRSTGCLGRVVGARSRWCGRVCEQEHRKDRPDSRRALDLEKPAMVVEDVLDDSQAEPGAAHFAGPRGVHPVEAFGQPGQVLARNPLALIAYGYGDRCVLAAAAFSDWRQTGRRADHDFRSGAPILDSIVDEVLEDLGE